VGIVIDQIVYDPAVANALVDPYPLYRRLRREQPVHRCLGRDLWVLSRFDDVDRALRDWPLFSSRVPFADARGHEILFTDPPHHASLRACVRDRFRAPAVAQLLALVRIVIPQLREALTAPRADVARDFAWPLALTAVSELVGVPPGDRAPLLDALQRRTYPAHFAEGEDPTPVEARAASSLEEAFTELVQGRFSAPTDDLLGDLAAAVTAGQLSSRAAVALADFLFEGLDTAANLIASAANALLAERPQSASAPLGEEAPAIVEELIRWDSPIQGTFRVTTEAATVRGVTIPKEALVYLLLASTNRDEQCHDDGDRLVLTRRPSRVLAFGTGTHVCPGAPLARLLLREALPTLLEVVRSCELVRVVRPQNAFTRAILELHVDSR
jgi:cytochrome P450